MRCAGAEAVGGDGEEGPSRAGGAWVPFRARRRWMLALWGRTGCARWGRPMAASWRRCGVGVGTGGGEDTETVDECRPGWVECLWGLGGARLTPDLGSIFAGTAAVPVALHAASCLKLT